MEKKLTKLRECFNQASCKCCLNQAQELENDPIMKAQILDAEVHKDLLDEDFQCAPENCWECSNILC